VRVDRSCYSATLSKARALPRATSWSYIQRYVCSRPSANEMDGSQPWVARMSALSLLRPRTFKGP
jgi:hypothetical protein